MADENKSLGVFRSSEEINTRNARNVSIIHFSKSAPAFNSYHLIYILILLLI